MGSENWKKAQLHSPELCEILRLLKDAEEKGTDEELKKFFSAFDGVWFSSGPGYEAAKWESYKSVADAVVALQYLAFSLYGENVEDFIRDYCDDANSPEWEKAEAYLYKENFVPAFRAELNKILGRLRCA